LDVDCVCLDMEDGVAAVLDALVEGRPVGMAPAVSA
jgi:hypothetical protein